MSQDRNIHVLVCRLRESGGGLTKSRALAVLSKGTSGLCCICLLGSASSSMLAFKLPFPGSLEVQVSQWEALGHQDSLSTHQHKSRGSGEQPPEPLSSPATPPPHAPPTLAPPLPPQLPSGSPPLPLQGSVSHRTMWFPGLGNQASPVFCLALIVAVASFWGPISAWSP